ncbi:MAG TPA: hypothetical protein ENN86_04730, partial [Desulfobacteraceae bacterium]|nr:hypothetical protein [Desulfobacteraceae bacterium]
MRNELFRKLQTGFISFFVLFVLSLLVSCGGGGGDDAPPPVGSIILAVTATSIPADGVSSTAITATLTNSLGAPVEEGTSVTFTTNLGFFSNGSSSINVETPDTSGKVTISLMAPATPGTARITVSGNGVTQRTNIEFTFDGETGVPVAEEFGVFAAYLNISGLWKMNLEDQITAGLGDVYGNAVKDGTPVNFKTYNTGGFITPSRVDTVSGFVSTSLFSTPNPAPMQGFLSVTAETEGGNTTRVTAIEVTPFPDNHIVYVGTNGGGIYKSTNSGQTWENISRSTLNSRSGQNFIDPYIKGHSAICVDPDNHNTIYAGTGYLGRGNVFRSLDGGMNWNSDNLEEWGGLYMYTPDAAIMPAPPSANVISNAAVLTVLCDGDNNPATDHPYVWIGTEGKGFLYAADGKHFQPSGGIVTPIWPTRTGSPIYVNPTNTGNGYMTEPMLWYTSKTENWTATCNVPVNASATIPVPDTGNEGDGWMSNVATSAQTVTESWLVRYTGRASTVFFSQGTAPVREPGNIRDINPSTLESWTVRCINADTAGSEVFRVEGSASGLLPNATFDETTPYNQVQLGFSWVDGDCDFVVGDRFEFSTVNIEFTPSTPGNAPGTLTGVSSPEGEDWTITCTDAATPGAEEFSVVGTATPAMPNATFGTDYNQPELRFSWIDGTDDFEVGDEFFITPEVNQVSFYPGNISYSNPGSLGNISVNSAVSETWIVTCTDATPDSEEFSVRGTVSGFQPNAAIGDYNPDGAAISFTINDGPDPWLVGSRFTFSTTTFWQVSGSVSGGQTNTATTGVPYASNGNEVGFTIYAGGAPFAVGDSFTFSTFAASSPFWVVEGSVSGIQPGVAQMGQLYRSDNNEVGFMIVQGSTPFVTGDTFRFHVEANNLNHGRTVWDIERIAGTHGSSAILYAGTSIGVFKSTNGGRTWTETGNFTGDYVICIELHPGSSGGATDVIYAGTQNGAVWVSTNSGTNWTRYSTGIAAGSFIKDIVLDPTNSFLYAVTYHLPEDAATGAVYSHAINANGSMKTGAWEKVSTDLAGTALHALAIDNPSDPGVLFTGGEGISLSRSVEGLDTGNPTWQNSSNGLSNLIMARMPILFSGQCSMSWDITRYDNTVWFKVYIEDQNGNPP